MQNILIHWRAWFCFSFLTTMFFLMCACSDGDSACLGDNLADGDEEGAQNSEESETSEDEETEAPASPGVVRFLHVSDIHYHGVPGDEQREYLQERVADMNGIEEPYDLIFMTGDIAHFMPQDYDDPATDGPLHLIVEEFLMLDKPYYPVIGNHEFYIQTDPYILTDNPEARKALWEEVMGYPVNFYVDYNGIRFIAMNSLDGEEWNTSKGLMGCFSTQQMQWLDEKLASGMPSFLFSHHPPISMAGETGLDRLCEVFNNHPGQIKGFFAGHSHEFVEGELCGVPYFVVNNMTLNEQHHYLVEYDGVNDTLEILNESDLPLNKPSEWACEPDEHPFDDPSRLIGSVQKLVMSNVATTAGGMASYLAAALEELPMILRFEEYNEQASRYQTKYTMGGWWEADGFTQYLDGAPCVDLAVGLEGGCVHSPNTLFEFDLAIFLEGFAEIPYDNSEWSARIGVEDFSFEGAIDDTGATPVIKDGRVTMLINTSHFTEDLKTIGAITYCNGEMEDCTPAEGELPECSGEPTAALYDSLPRECDVKLDGLPLRMVLGLIEDLPELIDAEAELVTVVQSESGEPMSGAVDNRLFSEEAGMNCALPE